MNNKEWTISYQKLEIAPGLREANYPPLLSLLLTLRGIQTKEQAQAVLCGNEHCLHDAMLIKDMDKAKERIQKAIEANETVSVYGDYDVDGITSTCLLTDYLCSKGLNCLPYIPDRTEEGYGLNCSALDWLKAQGVSLVITVDCGITAVNEARHAAEIGIDMIITDHHECKNGELPQVVALIDVKREGDAYPNKELAGVGVALKLVCACEGESADMLKRYADLAAIGTIADVMPLIGENRYLVSHGLECIASSPRLGIAAMLKAIDTEPKKLTAMTVGYSLAPRLNAAGRLGKTSVALKLLMSKDRESAEALADELQELNKQRQDIGESIWHEANTLLKGFSKKEPIVLHSESWHQGVIGIAASRLAEHYSLPTVIICMNGDAGKGSCRSYGDFNLFEALTACSEYLTGFGGHSLAAGLNIRRDMIDKFRKAMADYYHKHRPESVPEIKCELLINDPKLLSQDNVRALDLLEPYGNANPKPVMCICGARLEEVTDVGAGRHLRVFISFNGETYTGIFFSHNSSELGLRKHQLVDIAFTPQINEFHGSCNVQLVISAIRKHCSQKLCFAVLTGDGSVNWLLSSNRPQRADFARVWRAMDDGFVTGRTPVEIMEQCPSDMLPEKYCICLMAFLEAGLLKSQDGSVFSARRVNINGKVSLEATSIMRELLNT